MTQRIPVKLVVGGGFGVGKTTLIGAVSDIEPLRTEEVLTVRSEATDSLDGIAAKTTTTVAFDFGRLALDDDTGPPVELYLFGTPGQERFWNLWRDIAEGALGAVVLADTRRLESSFPAADFFEQRRLPYVIALNVFPRTPRRTREEVQEAFDVPADVPVVFCDARHPDSAASVLITLVRHILHAATRHTPLRDPR